VCTDGGACSEEAYLYEGCVSILLRDLQAQRRAGLAALPAGGSCGPLRKGQGGGMAASSAVLSQLSCLKWYSQEGSLQQCGEPVRLLCGAVTDAAACDMSVSASHSARGSDRSATQPDTAALRSSSFCGAEGD